MGCCNSKQIDDATTVVDVPAESKLAPSTASPNTKISTTSLRQASLPTGADITQFESSGRAAEWKETQPSSSANQHQTRRSTHKHKPQTIVNGYSPPEIPEPTVPPLPSPRSRRGSVATQPDEVPKSHRPSAPTDPGRKSPVNIDELQGLSPASGKLSEAAKAYNRTGQFTKSTEPMFTGAFSDVSQINLGNREVETKISSARQASRPTGTDMAQSESSGRAAGWGETIPPATDQHQTRPLTHKHKPQTVVNGYNPPEIPEPTVPPLPSPRSRRGSVATQPDEVPKPHSPSTSTDPGLNPPFKIDELQGLSASRELSEGVKAWDRTGQLTERTKTKFTGGFSDVSKAKLGDLVVAVKTLRHTDIRSDEEGRSGKRFAREIYIWAALKHPNVLEFLGFAIEDEKSCLISPWCENGTLKEYLQNFPDADRRRLVREIAEGLRYLHERTPPIIHGDLKTTNVFVTGDHVAKISDFGSSRLLGQVRTGLTTSGQVPSTTRYNAPEILRDGVNPTLCSDVFTFAYLALETMTGKIPWWRMSNDGGILHMVVAKKNTPSPEDHPGIDAATWDVLRRCWNYEPSDRPQMVEVCKMLSETRSGSSTGSYPSSRAGHSYPPPRGSTV